MFNGGIRKHPNLRPGGGFYKKPQTDKDFANSSLLISSLRLCEQANRVLLKIIAVHRISPGSAAAAD